MVNLPLGHKRVIYDLDLANLDTWVKEQKEPTYRTMQIWEGLYHHLWSSPDQFTNLSKSLRYKLDEHFIFIPIREGTQLSSKDGETTKVLFHLADQNAIEAVMMRYENRITICISSQAGCGMGCTFCATGQMGFKRNLTSGEIVAQVLHYARQLRPSDDRVTNVVLMGMGEPFHNYDNTLSAIDRLNNPQGFNMGERRFTISTVGLIPGIKRFTDEKRQINLAISLHAATDDLRSQMLPINKKYPLHELIAACREYVQKTNRRISFEWALIQDVNDTHEQALALAKLLQGLLCHVNVIPLNPTQKYDGKASSHQKAESFQKTLESQGIPCSLRLKRGIDIQAGCGQLATKVEQQ
jgi:23S rRNA (adenine2503-C2)-methyltransferase